MYLTAHRVRGHDGAEAIHAFLHEHEGVTWPEDVSAWPETNPGRLTHESTTLPLGGNRVQSYLDVLGPDGLGDDSVAAALLVFRGDLLERANPTVMVCDGITIRFGTDLGLEARRLAEFDQLGDVGRSLYASRG